MSISDAEFYGTGFKKLVVLGGCLLAFGQQSTFPADEFLPKPHPTYQADWRWLHGAVFVPTSVAMNAQLFQPQPAVRVMAAKKLIPKAATNMLTPARLTSVRNLYAHDHDLQINSNS